MRADYNLVGVINDVKGVFLGHTFSAASLGEAVTQSEHWLRILQVSACSDSATFIICFCHIAN